MSKYEVDDPILVEERKADNRGRVSLGPDYSGKRMKIVIEEVLDEEEGGDE